MKILREIITFIPIMLITFVLISIIKVNTLASSSINYNNGKIANVAVIIYKADDLYQRRFKESLENIEKDSNKNIKFTFFDPKNNIAIQNEIIDSIFKSNFDLVIVNPIDTKVNAVESIINAAKDKDIPLILINIPKEVVSEVSKIYNKVAFVTSDSKQSGTAQGKMIVDLWNNNNKVIDKNGDNILQYVLLKGPSQDNQAIDRTKYAISTINNSGIKTQELALVNAQWEKELAESSINNLFLRYDKNIEAIISNNDAMAIGAVEALQKYGYNTGNVLKYIAVFGLDGLPEAIDLIDKGLMSGTILQDPNIAAEMVYFIGMNLINNLNPTENTNYTTVDGEIMIPFLYNAYTGKLNNS